MAFSRDQAVWSAAYNDAVAAGNDAAVAHADRAVSALSEAPEGIDGRRLAALAVHLNGSPDGAAAASLGLAARLAPVLTAARLGKHGDARLGVLLGTALAKTSVPLPPLPAMRQPIVPQPVEGARLVQGANGVPGTIRDAATLVSELIGDGHASESQSLLTPFGEQEAFYQEEKDGKEQIPKAKKARPGDFKKILEGAGIYAPKAMIKPHPHHILSKRGRGAKQRTLVSEGQAYLRAVDIDPILAIENLVWAPNIAGQHTLEVLQKLLNELRSANQAGADRDIVIEILKVYGTLAADRQESER